MSGTTLYQRILGADFDRLPLTLQRFHGQTQGGRAAGTVAVKRGEHWASRRIAQRAALPPPGRQVPLQLQVVPQGDGELWIRHFAGRRIQTMQWQENGLLIEKAGPLHMVFQLEVDEGALRFHCRHNRWRGVRLPSCASLCIEAVEEAVEIADADSWNVAVNISSPLLGLVTSYAGEIRPIP